VALTTDNSSAQRAPDWSPTGERIVFRDYRTDAPGIYTMRPDGSDVTLVPGTALDYLPVWSPDGTRIAVLHFNGAGSPYSLDTIATDGSDRFTVVGDSYDPRAPDWQPVTTPVPLYARPKGATPLEVALVPSYRACDTPDRQHGPPLAAGSCSSPQQKSDFLSLGTLDSNGQPAKFRGLARFDVLRGNPATYADEADVKVTASLEDVRCKATYPTCEGGALSDYGGSLYASASIRITDQFNLPPHPAFDAATMVDSFPLFFTIPCVPTEDSTVGSTCSLSTTFEAVGPRVVKEGVRSIWQLGQIQVYDGGANGASFDESALFAVQGVFVP
jgi:WD40 repeat protein